MSIIKVFQSSMKRKISKEMKMNCYQSYFFQTSQLLNTDDCWVFVLERQSYKSY